ncbi:TPA: ring-hydroxylating dioxygenase ferredoxin reductase family protein [Pseudomonas putida]|jgi:benzoate/toluate 1,2-dioxygenase reductase subunit|uniref:Ring-hydroxylating dioxygenase ferredoxin reductase family protein n=1 Tax=Pseudomonas putida TaxID=303 RepID=A0AAP9SPN9_PSEPU|nr:benzoate 1,2-dioxygenase electron transfer component BenC [Pseudomonas putida]ELF6208623.1 ring-hydroxylating dioxygenase ferredoxin reductase family protein [Pseudomonas putida]ELU0816681.1 ring-hydroxylating dioxygenase ferredoxin reductase family protein [Pseudomonas putida]MCC9005465.1 ring-hydroxylating dioxygenase ferredoxin reductase family protein [Pseudomonas putida]QJQ10856.1 ring-hydroxylating dioxygenase ferredoxin reductase family protein [Pseudomonas putida]UVL75975.1 ring-hyd
MSYQIALNFEDGVTRFIEAAGHETVADAAYRQGINIPLDCRDGACGTCKCKAESGRYDLGDNFIEDALNEDEIAEGYVLTCQMRAESDCVIRIPASSQLCKTEQASFEAAISDVRQLSASTIALSIKGEALSRLAFLPGQYVNLKVPGSEQSRAYSFSSLQKGGEVSFLIRNVPGGLMSSFLTNLAKAGDSMSLAGPLGSFYLRPIQRPLLLLAGGTGLAPFTAMLEKIAEQGSEHPLHLIYGVTNDFDLVELDRLQALAARIPNFTYSACVANPDSQYPQKGYVTQHIEPRHLNDGDVDLYLCGPPPMVEAVSQYVREQGITPANFYYEKFAAAA